MKHANVAVFVPHAGCPEQCSFCNQRFISGSHNKPTPEQVRETVEQAARFLPNRFKPAQIAFFGGSFTAMKLEYMVSLLQSVQKYIDGQSFYGIRISTRPDAIDINMLDLLSSFNVTDIELGAQSMENSVLAANYRGHTEEDTIKAVKMIRSKGFGLGLQIMLGLYSDSTEITLHTVHKVINLKPDCVRIYPTVVLNDTGLAKLYEQGKYIPLTLEEAIDLGQKALEIFTEHGIPVIRLGLHDSPDLTQNMLAGPHHPAFRELCESRILMRKTLELISKNAIGQGDIIIEVSPGAISKIIGQKRVNLNLLRHRGYNAKIRQNSDLSYLEIQVLQRM